MPMMEFANEFSPFHVSMAVDSPMLQSIMKLGVMVALPPPMLSVPGVTWVCRFCEMVGTENRSSPKSKGFIIDRRFPGASYARCGFQKVNSIMITPYFENLLHLSMIL